MRVLPFFVKSRPKFLFMPTDRALKRALSNQMITSREEVAVMLIFWRLCCYPFSNLGLVVAAAMLLRKVWLKAVPCQDCQR